jgi:DNA-binding Xre family transcriptional regulator
MLDSPKIASVGGDICMAISYKKMWKLLIDKNMSMADLRKIANIAPNTMTKLRRNEPVNLAILGRVCAVLQCDFVDIIEYIPEE